MPLCCVELVSFLLVLINYLKVLFVFLRLVESPFSIFVDALLMPAHLIGHFLHLKIVLVCLGKVTVFSQVSDPELPLIYRLLLEWEFFIEVHVVCLIICILSVGVRHVEAMIILSLDLGKISR